MWVDVAVGSSPRVRGKHASDFVLGCSVGLIPACAGKTVADVVCTALRPAHPRVCGENAPSPARPGLAPGSSPRVRGKPGDIRRSAILEGLIPACAGKTQLSGKSGPGQWAHPRVCGENRIARTQSVQRTGSSPRVRGKLHRYRGLYQRIRLIPACAGKTGTG